MSWWFLYPDFLEGGIVDLTHFHDCYLYVITLCCLTCAIYIHNGRCFVRVRDGFCSAGEVRPSHSVRIAAIYLLELLVLASMTPHLLSIMPPQSG